MAPDAHGFAVWECEQDEAGHVQSNREPGTYADAEEMLCWLALHTGDEDFMNLVQRASLSERRLQRWRDGIVMVRRPVVGYEVVGREVHERFGEASVVPWSKRDDENRAHSWRRVLMYLAGDKRAASLTRLGIEGGAVLHAYVRAASGRPERGAWLPGWLSLVPPRARPLTRVDETSVRGRSLRKYLDSVERCRQGDRSEVWWTAPGDPRRHGYNWIELPRGARARRGAVRRQLLAADRAARRWVAPKTVASGAASARRARMRLDDYTAHVVAYLLLKGFAGLPPHPPREAAAAFTGCRGHETAIALYKHRDAARKLIAGWQTVGSE